MSYFGNLNPYQIHQKLINDYILKRPGDTSKLYVRDTSKDKRDIDVIRENHRFLWNDESDRVDSWEKQLAKKYYDKLFKEYCIADLSRYKENKIALRWRIEREVVTGKGQFICGNKKCENQETLRSWEINFAYTEDNTKKNALVKIRLCTDCSEKLNYHSQKREVKRLKEKKQKVNKSKRKSSRENSSEPPTSSASTEHQQQTHTINKQIENEIDYRNAQSSTSNPNRTLEQECWANQTNVEEKNREEEFDEYLENLLL